MVVEDGLHQLEIYTLVFSQIKEIGETRHMVDICFAVDHVLKKLFGDAWIFAENVQWIIVADVHDIDGILFAKIVFQKIERNGWIRAQEMKRKIILEIFDEKIL